MEYFFSVNACYLYLHICVTNVFVVIYIGSSILHRQNKCRRTAFVIGWADITTFLPRRYRLHHYGK